MAKKKLKKKQQAENDAFYADCDETFAFIAGYTSGGMPYGTTWEELGLEPLASAEEIDAAYERQMQGTPQDGE
ncbi:hypothetical protein [Eisenbergiella sp.]